MIRYKTVNQYFAQFPATPGRALVVGSKYYEKKMIDRRHLYDLALGVDMQPGNGVDIVHDMENALPDQYGKFNHIDCVSVMEHCKRPWLMAENIQRVMLPGASIYLSIPFSWRLHGYPDDYYRFSTKSFKVLFPEIRWESRGYYLSDGVWRHLVPSLNIDKNKYIERAEAVGYGLFVP